MSTGRVGRKLDKVQVPANESWDRDIKSKERPNDAGVSSELPPPEMR
jgi:hypothetical protein